MNSVKLTGNKVEVSIEPSNFEKAQTRIGTMNFTEDELEIVNK